MSFSHLIPELVLLTLLSGISALLLVFARQRFEPESDEIVTSVNKLLPQTQCAQCGYPGCRPYAEAIAGGEAINRCPPGGDETIVQLANLLGREPMALDDSLMDAVSQEPRVVMIREADCIGCTLCIAACPVDAIVGATRMMHTVIEDRCTGCDLCIEPCPVDCIEIKSIGTPPAPPVFPIEAMACINCGLCEEACPRDLQPQLLYRARRNPEQVIRHNLNSCIECVRCDQVCPSGISLTGSFRASKQYVRQLEAERQAADLNEQRFEARELRLASSSKKIVKRPSRGDKQALLEALKESS